VFEIEKTGSGYASTPTILYNFCAQGAWSICTDGTNPYGGLLADANGNLFGTTFYGGTAIGSTTGTVFEIEKTASGYASTPTILINFNGTNGDKPPGGLIADANSNLYGTTDLGGAKDAGTVFEIAKTVSGYASTPTVLVSFNGADGKHPSGGLLADANGNLFGTTNLGGANDLGTVFEIEKTASGYTSTPTVLVRFDGADGANPFAGLIADANGNLFGTTFYGGASNLGTVFEIAKTASGYASSPTILVSFNGADGQIPEAGLIADANGNLYGTTLEGGANGGGTVFEIEKTASGYTSTPNVLVSFNGANGWWPEAGLIVDASGNLFGTTGYGGANSAGTVFELQGTGFVTFAAAFAGTRGTPNCAGVSVSALAQQYGGIRNAAAARGYSSVAALQDAIRAFCRSSE
jgi:uncharacterized repeat protein (TIGR03803 family)